MSNKDAEIKKALKEDYPLIPMKDITDEARIIAVAWMECGDKNWIGQKHKLASDIMNYARRRSAEKDKEISTLKQTIMDQDKQILELKDIINAARLAFKEICTGTDLPLSTAQNGLRIIDKYLNNK